MSGHPAIVVAFGVVGTPDVLRDQEVGGMVNHRLPATVQSRRYPRPRQRANLVVRERGEAPEVHGHLRQKFSIVGGKAR